MALKVVIALPCSSFMRQVRAKAKTTLLIACKFKYQVSVPPGKIQTQRSLCVSTFFYPRKQQTYGAAASRQNASLPLTVTRFEVPWTTPQLLISMSLHFIACHLLVFTAIIFLSLFPQSSFIFSSVPGPPSQRLTYWSLYTVPCSHKQAPSKIKLQTFIGRQTHKYYM